MRWLGFFLLFVSSESQVSAVLSVLAQVPEARGVKEAGAVIPGLHRHRRSRAARVSEQEPGECATKQVTEKIKGK